MTNKTSLSEQQKDEAVELMERFGGGFVQKLALAWRSADNQNRKLIEQVFLEKYFVKYLEDFSSYYKK